MNRSHNRNIPILAILLLTIKILYIISIDMMLSDNYMLWSFNKDIDYFYIIIELLPFFVCEYLVLHRYEKGDAHSFFGVLLFIIFFIPANSGLSVSGNQMEYYWLINLYSVILFFAFMLFRPKESEIINEEVIVDLTESNRYMTAIRIFMVIVCLISIIRTYMYNGLNLSFAFSDMYSVRSDYASYYANNTGSFTSYLLLIVTNLGSWFMPIYLYYALVNKKPFDTILSLFSILAVFTIEMMKAQLLIIPIVIFFAILKRRDKLYLAAEKLAKGMIYLIIIAIVEFKIRGESFIFDLIVRRLFYIPTYMINIHYGFYSTHDKILFTNDAFFIQYIARFVFGTKYVNSSVKVISDNCFRGLLPSPNTGMFAEAYAQLGVAGIFVFPFIILWITNLIRKYSQSYGDGAVLVALTYLSIRLISVYILTSSTLIGIIEFVLISMLFRFLQKNKAIKENALS